MESLQSFGRGDVLHVSIYRRRSCVVIFAHNLLFRQVVFAATDFFMRFFGKVLNENVPLRLVFNLIFFQDVNFEQMEINSCRSQIFSGRPFKCSFVAATSTRSRSSRPVAHTFSFF